MRKIVISDTSCFIIISKIDELNLLNKMFEMVITTNDIAQEFGEQLPSWVTIQNAAEIQKQQILETQIDKGESSAIALALEVKNCTLVLDDNKARKIASQLGLNITGTIGIIIKAKLMGIIPSIKPFLYKIKETNFRITPELEMLALQQADEF